VIGPNHKIESWIVAHDCHFPKYDRRTFQAMLSLMHDIRPHGFIFGGDQFDNSEISRHNKGKPIYRERGSCKRNTVRFDAEILRRIESIIGKGDKIWIEGNHDFWTRQSLLRNIRN
jgi:hypothetical protein